MSAIVIDAEDREAVEKFARHYVTAYMERVGYGTPWEERKPERREQIIADVQTTFRAMQEPPKPPEPRGAAALVEDDMGDWWARLSRGTDGTVWHRIGHPETKAGWRDITAVRVLSEGVTP